MSRRELIEILGSAITLSVSLWIAFGPLRHRLPRFLTRLAKYSVALKLLVLSGLCWWGFYTNREYHGYHALRWCLLILAIGLIGGAVYVLTLKSRPRASGPAGPTPGIDPTRPQPSVAVRPAIQPVRSVPVESRRSP